MEDLILKLLNLFCPYLKEMAKKTGNPVDDIIVNILCKAAEQAKTKSK
jgi:hypothetical protein